MNAIILLLDGSHGIYIPRDFVLGYWGNGWKGVSADTLAACEDVRSEEYWDAWDYILDNATWTDWSTGNVYRLHQDSDLWAVCETAMSDIEYADFIG